MIEIGPELASSIQTLAALAVLALVIWGLSRG